MEVALLARFLKPAKKLEKFSDKPDEECDDSGDRDRDDGDDGDDGDDHDHDHDHIRDRDRNRNKDEDKDEDDGPGISYAYARILELGLGAVIIAIGVFVMLGVLASYLSWTSNTVIGWHPVFRVIFAVFAFLFSTTYLVSHLFFKLDLLLALQTLARVSLVSNAATNVAKLAATYSPSIRDPQGVSFRPPANSRPVVIG